MSSTALGGKELPAFDRSARGSTAAPGKLPRPLSGIASDALVRHLYVHLPFCAHRCGYCDFVTVVGRRGQHAGYVDGLLA
jgi:coproporphyrinogen III oxidase-like Fe-S oxidoreductase